MNEKDLTELELENHVLNHFVEIKLIRVVKGGYTLTDKGLMFRSFLNGFGAVKQWITTLHKSEKVNVVNAPTVSN